MRKSDGCIEHGPDDTLGAGRRGQGALVPEEMVEVLGEHGAHVETGYVHGLICRGYTSATLHSDTFLRFR